MNYFFIFLTCVFMGEQFLYAPQTIISQSGEYVIDITRDHNPEINNDPIIRIDASNVVLDFQGHSISQGSLNTQIGIDGVSITAAVSNVTIKNAFIKNLSGVGIRVSNACSKISVIDSSIQSCQTSGILLNGTFPGVIGAEIKNTTVSTCTGAGGSPAYGIRIIKGTSVGIFDSTVNLNDASTTSSGYGISLENCQQCAIVNTNAVSNGGSGIAAGVSIISGTNILLQDVFAQNNINHDTTYAGTAYGISIDQSLNVLGLNCRCAANVNTSSFCYGLAVQNGQKNVFEDCILGFNKAASLSAGILLNNEFQTIINNCTSRGNQTTVTGTAYGILLTGTCDQCSLSTNHLLNNKGIITTFGIRDEKSPSTSIALGNLAFNNGTNFSVTYTIGVTLPITDVSLINPPGFTNINDSNKHMNINIVP